MAWMQISTELTITLTSYLPRTLVVTSQTAFIVIILVVKLRRTVSQFMWQRLASLSCGTFVNLRTRSYQFLNVARSNGLICIIIFDWMFLLHVSMHQEQGLFTTNLSWRLLGLLRLIKILQKIKYRGAFHSSKSAYGKVSRNPGSCWISEMWTIQLKILKKIPERSWMERTIPLKKKSKTWVYLACLSSFLEILETVVPFATGSYRKLKPDVLGEWK